jgi:hypothetical protein
VRRSGRIYPRSYRPEPPETRKTQAVGSRESIKCNTGFTRTNTIKRYSSKPNPKTNDFFNKINLNYAIALGDLSSLFPSFGEDGIASLTLRTTVFATETVAPVPLPAGTPLMLAGLAALGCLRPRKRTQAV